MISIFSKLYIFFNIEILRRFAKLIFNFNFNFNFKTSVQSAQEDSSVDPNMQIKGRIMIKLFYEKKSSNLAVTM